MEIKQMIKMVVENEIYDNWGTLCGAVFIEAECMGDQKAKQQLEELKKLELEYKFEIDTPLKDVIASIK